MVIACTRSPFSTATKIIEPVSSTLETSFAIFRWRKVREDQVGGELGCAGGSIRSSMRSSLIS